MRRVQPFRGCLHKPYVRRWCLAAGRGTSEPWKPLEGALLRLPAVSAPSRGPRSGARRGCCECRFLESQGADQCNTLQKGGIAGKPLALEWIPRVATPATPFFGQHMGPIEQYNTKAPFHC